MSMDANPNEMSCRKKASLTEVLKSNLFVSSLHSRHETPAVASPAPPSEDRKSSCRPRPEGDAPKRFGEASSCLGLVVDMIL